MRPPNPESNTPIAFSDIIIRPLKCKVNEFFYIHNKKELLDWIAEDAIVIKLTGSEKVEAVNRLYSEILMDTKGTAYTLIRVAYNESYNSLFSDIESNDFNQTDFNDDDYGD